MKLHFQKTGEGPAFLILHGLFGSHKNWKTQSSRLATQFQVYGIDLRNHGDSPHQPDMNYPLMAEDVLQLMDDESLDQTIVLGHSMGAKVAMELALAYPDRVTKLIAVDMAPKKYPARLHYILKALNTVDLTQHQTRQAVDDALASGINEDYVRQFLLTNLKRDSQNQFEWKMNLNSIQANYEALTFEIKGGRTYASPTLLIKGNDSNYIVEEDTPLIKTLFPQASIQSIPNAGHWVHFEAADAFFKTVMAFVSE